LSISLITALNNAELEDVIISCLTPQGFTLKKRCYSQESLMDAISTLESDTRAVIFFMSGYHITREQRAATGAESIAYVEISSDSRISADEIQSRAMEALRNPELAIASRTSRKQERNWLTFTGSTSAPGISTVTLNVASELSQKRVVTLLDVDSHRKDQHFMLGMQYEVKSKVSSNLSLFNIESEVMASELDNTSSHVNCIDLGAAPSLDSLLTDRRLSGRRFLEVIEQSTHIIYVLQAERHGIAAMDKFQRFIAAEIKSASVIYILNKMGNSSRHNALRKSFQAQLGDHRGFILPRDNDVLDRAQGHYSALSEVGQRTPLRRALRELSLYLDELI
jgi:hypothetical protein